MPGRGVPLGPLQHKPTTACDEGQEEPILGAHLASQHVAPVQLERPTGNLHLTGIAAIGFESVRALLPAAGMGMFQPRDSGERMRNSDESGRSCCRRP